MGKTLRRLAVFLLCVAVLQGLAMLFLTPTGLEKVFVVPLRLAGEKFRPDTNTYAEADSHERTGGQRRNDNGFARKRFGNGLQSAQGCGRDHECV